EERGEILAEEAASRAEEMSRREVGESDPAVSVDQNQRDRGVLGHRIEQALALYELRALCPQGPAEIIVRGEHLADLVRAVDGHGEGKIPVPVARDGRRQWPHEAAYRPGCGARQV